MRVPLPALFAGRGRHEAKRSAGEGPVPETPSSAFGTFSPAEKRGGEGLSIWSRRYFPSTAFLKSSPIAGFGPIQVETIASAVALPGSVPFSFPLTSTVVPLPGT